ncbi:MAG: hypothetical protein DWQ36_17015 [Acidobacteria bacterium]|nr:MAG: hypothetical protein DWQ36_17015 [Acidobacteriota bacterium]
MSDERERFRRLEARFVELESLTARQRDERLLELEESEPDLFPELRDLIADGTSTDHLGLETLARDAAALVGGGHEASTRDDAAGRAKADASPSGESFGRSIGRYRLLRRIGVGGMGEVWEARQEEPVRRKVALKVLRRGVETPARIARFEAERQALATMDHPNIARVFDGGETPEGHPFFVMELVEEGVPITTYCAARQLDLEARLRLFVPVCEAVDHAHRKRIIHRDLKPSNVLVTEDGGQPVVKVIDFGIAKPLEEQWASETHATMIGQLVGTPEYMSPEQAALGAVDIDTRSDVFTLGLLLFELIVGDLPLAAKELRKLPFDELCRRIREDDTPLASSVLRSQSTQGGPSTLSGTWRRVQGDLDRIVAKALAKDRDQRYRAAAELADDLRRFLEHEPVLATPPSGVYRFQKFVRRNRVAVAAASFLLIGLVVGLAVALIGFRRARAAEAEALENLAALESSEQFLVGLFRGATPAESLGEDPPASELLERGIERLEKLDDQPAVQARLLGNLAEVQRERGAYDAAEDLQRRAIALYDDVVEAPIQRAIAQARLGAIHRRRNEPAEAEALYREALAAFDELDPDHASVGGTLNELAMILNDTGRYDDATAVYDQLIEMHRDNPDSPRVALPAVLFNSAVNRSAAGDRETAIDQLMESLALFREILPENHPSLGTLHSTLAIWHKEEGLLDCARRHHEVALAIDREVLPAGHPHLGESLLAVGDLELRQGRVESAEVLWIEARRILAGALGEESERVSQMDRRLALLALRRGRAAEAVEGLLRSQVVLADLEPNPERNRVHAGHWRLLAVALRTQALEADAPRDGDAGGGRSRLLQRAEQALDRAAELSALEGAAPETAPIRLQRAVLAAQRGDAERAWALLAEAEELAGTDPDDSLDDPTLYQFRAQIAALLGDADRAFEWAAAAMALPHRTPWIVEAPEMRRLADDPRYSDLERSLWALLEGEGSECRGLEGASAPPDAAAEGERAAL